LPQLTPGECQLKLHELEKKVREKPHDPQWRPPAWKNMTKMKNMKEANELVPNMYSVEELANTNTFKAINELIDDEFSGI
jgi:hypothetical protein